MICFQRLEIIDSIYGMQPMKLHRYPHVILICNGEIYNWTQASQFWKKIHHDSFHKIHHKKINKIYLKLTFFKLEK